MDNEKNLNNIPSLSISSIIESLAALYCGAINNGVPFKRIFTPFLWGAAGVGKSAGVYQLAELIEEKTGKTTSVTDIRLLLYSPVDLKGIPSADAEKRFTNWLMPKVFNLNPGAEHVNLLFLDELSAAPQQVQAAAYQICLDRKIGDFSLPDNCIVIAAGNRTTDQSVSYKMPKALCNRLMHFTVTSAYDKWRDWAVGEGIDDRIIAYLGFANNKLCVEPESSDLAFCTPRSWAAVSALLQACGGEIKPILNLIAAHVGNDTANEFKAFCDGYVNMPPVSEIIKGRCKVLPKTHDIMYATVSSLVTLLRDKGDTLSVVELDNLCEYVTKLSRDFCMMFMKDVKRIKGMEARLIKCATFQGWLSKNKNLW